MTRYEPSSQPPEPDYATVVTLGAPVKCVECDAWLHCGDVVLMNRFGFAHPACLGEGAA